MPLLRLLILPPAANFIRFDQHVDKLYMNEAHKRSLLCFLLNDSPENQLNLGKQSENFYTRAAFEMFQMELIESLHHNAVNVQDSPYEANYVIYNISEKKTWCGSCRFAFLTILCRHLLRVFILADANMILEPFITKRWTKMPVFVGSNLEDENHHSNSATSRFSDLVCDTMMCAERGTLSAGSFKVVKEVLLRAFREIDKLTNAGLATYSSSG
jgi:hypothetical protein